MPHFVQPRRAFGVLLIALHRAFKRAGRKPMTRRNRTLVALVVTLVVVLVLLPAGLIIAVRISEARWETAHPVQTMVPDVTGRDRATAEAAVRNAQLVPHFSFVAIKDKCWQDQPAPNTVVDQDPKAISPVPVQTDVHLVLGVDSTANPPPPCCGPSP
jgi:hypothetical protein